MFGEYFLAVFVPFHLKDTLVRFQVKSHIEPAHSREK